LLRALAADDVNAGKIRVAFGNQSRDLTGVYAVRLSDAAIANLRNGDAQPLSMTTAVAGEVPHIDLPQGTEIARHIYRLNGVELSPQARPAHGEAYLVELSGKAPADNGDGEILLQDSASGALRPVGCALSAKLDPPAFAPWFTPHDLSAVASCEESAYGITIVLAPRDIDNANFKAVYIAHIDAASVAALPPPQIRLIK